MKDILKVSRPNAWLLTIFPFLAFGLKSYSYLWVMIGVMFFSLPYNYIIYWIDEVTDNKAKGLYEILLSPACYIFPLAVGMAFIDWWFLALFYVSSMSIDTLHRIHQKEISDKATYIVSGLFAIPPFLIRRTKIFWISPLYQALYYILIIFFLIVFLSSVLFQRGVWDLDERRDIYWSYYSSFTGACLFFLFAVGMGVV